MNATTTAIAPKEKSEIEFVPFGGEDKIKLSIAIIKSFVANPTKSGAMPQDRDCMKFMMLCRSRRLNPFEGDAFLLGYDGKDGPQFSLITAHQAFLKRAETHPEYDGMESGVIVQTEDGEIIDRTGDFYIQGDTLLGGWATVFFRTRSHAMKKRLRLKTFQKPFGVWQSDPAGMICKCAEADALRSSFPQMLGGMYLRDEIDAGKTVDSEPAKPEIRKPLFAAPVEVGPTYGNPPTDDSVQYGNPPTPRKRTAKAPAEPVAESEPVQETEVPLESENPVYESPKEVNTPNEDLAEFVTVEKTATFDQFCACMVNLQWVKGAQVDVWTSFDDIPIAIVQKCLKSKSGLGARLEDEKALNQAEA